MLTGEVAIDRKRDGEPGKSSYLLRILRRAPGALGLENGSVDLSWREDSPNASDGADSFGSRVIRSALAKVAGGEVNYQRQPGTVSCEFSWPASSPSS